MVSQKVSDRDKFLRDLSKNINKITASALKKLPGAPMYSVFTKLGDGKLLFVASREDLEQAAQLVRELSAVVQELNANWPNEYVVRDSKGNNVDPNNC
jgi:hypothetical protein